MQRHRNRTRAAVMLAGFGLVAACLLSPRVCTAQNNMGGIPASNGGYSTPPHSIPSGQFTASPPPSAEQIALQHTMMLRQMDDRFRKVQSNTAKLVKLTSDLAAETSSAAKLDSAKTAARLDEIEKLSRSVRDMEGMN